METTTDPMRQKVLKPEPIRWECPKWMSSPSSCQTKQYHHITVKVLAPSSWYPILPLGCASRYILSQLFKHHNRDEDKTSSDQPVVTSDLTAFRLQICSSPTTLIESQQILSKVASCFTSVFVECWGSFCTKQFPKMFCLKRLFLDEKSLVCNKRKT